MRKEGEGMGRGGPVDETQVGGWVSLDKIVCEIG